MRTELVLPRRLSGESEWSPVSSLGVAGTHPVEIPNSYFYLLFYRFPFASQLHTFFFKNYSTVVKYLHDKKQRRARRRNEAGGKGEGKMNIWHVNNRHPRQGTPLGEMFSFTETFQPGHDQCCTMSLFHIYVIPQLPADFPTIPRGSRGYRWG